MPEEAPDHGKTVMTWTFREFPRYRRGRGWYVWMLIAGVGLVTIAVIQQNPLFAIIIFVAWALLFYRSRLTPLSLTAKITEDGLEVGREFYAFDDIDTFWIIFKARQTKVLVLRFKSAFRAKLDIPIDDVNPLHLKQTLRRFLKEDLTQTDESASDAFGRMFKF